MSLPKAQLVDPQGNMNLPGMTATGVVTATSLSGIATGSVTNLTGSPDLDVGIVTGSSFVGDGTGHAASLTGTPNLNLGVTTATSFVGDAVGKAAGLTGTPNLNVGLITATSFVGFVTGNVTGNVSGDVTGNVTGNIAGDVDGDVVGNISGNVTGLASSFKSGANLGVGVCTALEYHGDGSGLTGAGSSAYIAQVVTASGAETIINLTYGNVIDLSGKGPHGTHLGGTGIAISSKSKNKDLALEYSYWIAGSECQQTTFCVNGGQPGNSEAWENDTINLETNNFFKNTRLTLDQAWVRPRHNGYMKFQDESGNMINEYLQSNVNEVDVIDKLKLMYAESFEE